MPRGFWQQEKNPDAAAIWNVAEGDLDGLIRCRNFVRTLLKIKEHDLTNTWYNLWTWGNAARIEKLIEEGCQLLTPHGCSYLHFGLSAGMRRHLTEWFPTEIRLDGTRTRAYLDPFLCLLPNHDTFTSFAAFAIAQAIATQKGVDIE